MVVYLRYLHLDGEVSCGASNATFLQVETILQVVVVQLSLGCT